MTRRTVKLATAGAIALGVAVACAAVAAEDHPSPPVLTPYVPSTSDMMIATIQPRHERLWQAAQAHDWAFAAYELGNLRGAFQRIGQAHPTIERNSLPDMIASVTDQPLADLKAAIQSRDETAFAKAYAGLTDGCNSCHQALNHEVVVIGVPAGTSTSDQAFTATKPQQ